MFRVLFLLILPLFVFALESNIYRIGSASISDDDKNSVGGTLIGFKKHVNNGSSTFGADINHIFVDDNKHGVDDTTELMLHLGAMATDALEIYGSFGYAFEGSGKGPGYGAGLRYAISDGFNVTYEYRKFDMDKYDLESSSFGILIGF